MTSSVQNLGHLNRILSKAIRNALSEISDFIHNLAYYKLRQFYYKLRQVSLLQIATKCYYKLRHLVYYKLRQFYYKLRQLYYKLRHLLQIATIITNFDA